MAISPRPGQPRVTIDPYSACATQIFLRFGATPLATATCFFWQHGRGTYLVTNWHNVTGRDAQSLRHLDQATLAEPDRALYPVFMDGDLNRRGQSTMELYTQGGEPAWLEHPTHGRLVDVVCLRLPEEAAGHVFPVNRQPPGPLTTRIADDVFILGYPLGLAVETTPLWKRASVASEPDFDIDGLPKMFVDTASTRGMSGSPVLRRGTSGQTADGTMSLFVAPVTSVVGVYSGRVVGANSVEAQLGVVWKARVIDEIIDGQRQGARPTG